MALISTSPEVNRRCSHASCQRASVWLRHTLASRARRAALFLLHHYGRQHPLSSIAAAHGAPFGAMRGHHRKQRRRAQGPLLCCVFHHEPRQFLRFLGRDLPQSGCSLMLIRRKETGTAIRKPRHDGGDGSRVTRGQSCIDGREDRSPGRALAGDEQLHLGIVHSDQCAAGARPDIGSIVSHFDGRPVFEDPLAWPAQDVRYWSRSHPLPRSRSFQ